MIELFLSKIVYNSQTNALTFISPSNIAIQLRKYSRGSIISKKEKRLKSEDRRNVFYQFAD